MGVIDPPIQPLFDDNIQWVPVPSPCQEESPLSLENKVILYKQILRPVITYGSPVWGAAAATHMKKIQANLLSEQLKKNEAAIRKSVISGTKLSIVNFFIVHKRCIIRKNGKSHRNLDRGTSSKKDSYLTVDGVVGLEGDNDEEEKSTPLTGKLIQEGLQLCSKLENHFLINDPNSERASKLQRRATQNENEVCEDPWPLPQISNAETVSPDDEGDLEPLRKRCKPLSDSDN
ncbi:hypothetical protein TNCV_1091601 [Trichonephila clavipes]|nr:hypothetical protein TNCV_1091601 [Trichonephila clavipes]